MFKQFRIIQNIITPCKAKVLTDHLDKVFRRKKYEGNHWDDVIVNYKEIELTSRNTTPEIDSILKPIQLWIQNETRTTNKSYLPVHAIDVSEEGKIAPHVDSVKFSGGIVAGLSLLSTRILRLERENNSSYNYSIHDFDNGKQSTMTSSQTSATATSDCYLSDDSYEFYVHPCSLYILQGALRYEYSHAILGKQCTSKLLYPVDAINRRISLMFRDVV